MTSTSSDTSPPEPGETRVEICARPPHTSFLVVDYQGRRPPVALFADLEMIGWHPPVVSPPPKEAIDWDHPNPETGERFTVRDYRVDGAVVEPPAGSGPRGTWTPHEGAAFMRSLHGVLQRHGLDTTDTAATAALPPPPAPAPAGTAPPPPAPPPGPAATAKARRTTRRGRLRDLTDSTPSPAAAGSADSVEALSAIMAIPDGGAMEISAIAPPARFPGIEDAVAVLGLAAEITQTQVEKTERFRGSESTVTVSRFRIAVVAPPEVASAAVDAFTANDVRPDLAILTAADVAKRRPITQEDEAEDPELALIRRAHPCVHVICDPPRIDAVSAIVGQLGLRFWQRTPTQVESIATFRGTQSVTMRPAMAFEVWAPPQHAPRVLAELAAAAGLNPETQTDRAFITDADGEPEPATGDDPEAATGPAAAGTPEPGAAEVTPVDPPEAFDELDLELDELASFDGLGAPPAPLSRRVSSRSDSGDEVLTRR